MRLQDPRGDALLPSATAASPPLTRRPGRSRVLRVRAWAPYAYLGVLLVVMSTDRHWVVSALSHLATTHLGNVLLGVAVGSAMSVYLLVLRVRSVPFTRRGQLANSVVVVVLGTIWLITAPSRHNLGTYNHDLDVAVPGFLPGWVLGGLPLVALGLVMVVQRKRLTRKVAGAMGRHARR